MNRLVGSLEDESLHVYSDTEFLDDIECSSPLVTTRQESIVALSPTLVAKPVPWGVDPQDEVQAIVKARSIGINAPQARRVVSDPDDGGHYIIMDRVQGRTLEQLWPSLGLLDTIRVGRQLRGYVRAMQSVTAQTTGGLHSGVATSTAVGDLHGPARHASPAVFSQYLQWWLLECRPEYCKPLPHLVLPPPTQHVFVHQDLALRNMILDPDGVLWLVDWNLAGFYPDYMEYLGMTPSKIEWIFGKTWAAWWGRVRWELLRWLVFGRAGRYRKEREMLAHVRQRSLRYRLEKTPFSDFLPS
ncbi:kinase-like protein [Lentinus tigrinus ALCF2SS1-7]|uniref:Kinase-like protein n=1 Tax=Lentinus tigrinus ALCF2SS1-6 TaxID=1328759 RepID=A0A5C2SNL8_9APHY|nr:kinase-like protein [Lentinus tigrinus ALCF2SS1-6]RPD79228.1 kinase-like protein [Lentinus tigrinus ALCF2SS1-7]